MPEKITVYDSLCTSDLRRKTFRTYIIDKKNLKEDKLGEELFQISNNNL